MDRDYLLRQLAILGDQYSAALDIGHARHTGVWPRDLAAMLVERDDAATRILADCRERLADAIMAAIEAAKAPALTEDEAAVLALVREALDVHTMLDLGVALCRINVLIRELHCKREVVARDPAMAEAPQPEAVSAAPSVPTGPRDGEPVAWNEVRFGDKVTGIFEPPSPDDRHWLVIAQSNLLIWVRNKRSSELAMSTSVNADRWNQIAPTRGWTDAPAATQEPAQTDVEADASAAEDRIQRVARALHEAQGDFPWYQISERTRRERVGVASVLIRIANGEL